MDTIFNSCFTEGGDGGHKSHKASGRGRTLTHVVWLQSLLLTFTHSAALRNPRYLKDHEAMSFSSILSKSISDSFLWLKDPGPQSL